MVTIKHTMNIESNSFRLDSVILGGVEIGEGCVIGACSLVLHDVPAHSIFYNERTIIMKDNNKPIGKY